MQPGEPKLNGPPGQPSQPHRHHGRQSTRLSNYKLISTSGSPTTSTFIQEKQGSREWYRIADEDSKLCSRRRAAATSPSHRHAPGQGRRGPYCGRFRLMQERPLDNLNRAILGSELSGLLVIAIAITKARIPDPTEGLSTGRFRHFPSGIGSPSSRDRGPLESARFAELCSRLAYWRLGLPRPSEA